MKDFLVKLFLDAVVPVLVRCYKTCKIRSPGRLLHEAAWKKRLHMLILLILWTSAVDRILQKPNSVANTNIYFPRFQTNLVFTIFAKTTCISKSSELRGGKWVSLGLQWEGLLLASDLLVLAPVSHIRRKELEVRGEREGGSARREATL